MAAGNTVQDLLPLFDFPLDQELDGAIFLGALKGAHRPLGLTFHFTLPAEFVLFYHRRERPSKGKQKERGISPPLRFEKIHSPG